MDEWIDNAYVHLAGEKGVLQAVRVRFVGGWVHVIEPDAPFDGVTAYPASAVTKVTWREGQQVRTIEGQLMR